MKRVTSKPSMVVRIADLDAARNVHLIGRNAWMMDRLLTAGASGVSTLECPAIRVSHYVFCLRRMGFSIETVDEPHGGDFSGHHARYVLHSTVNVVEPFGANVRAAA